MTTRVAVLIDGGHLRVLARRAGFVYDPDYIEKVAHACPSGDEAALRFLYYDCAFRIQTDPLPKLLSPICHRWTRQIHDTFTQPKTISPIHRASQKSAF